MALATQCPYCHTIFKVVSDQLKLRGGIVRCGRCSQAFDGNAGLVDAATALKAAAPAAPLAAPVASTLPAPEHHPEPDHHPAPEHPADARVADPLFALHASDLAQQPDQSEPEFELEIEPEAGLESEPELALEAELDLDLDFDLDAEPAPGSRPGSETKIRSDFFSKRTPDSHWIDLDALSAADSERLQREAMLTAPIAPVEPASASRQASNTDPDSASNPFSDLFSDPFSDPTPVPDSAAASDPDPVWDPIPARSQAAEADEPRFVMQGRRNQRHGKTVSILLGLGSLVLLLALLAQGAIIFGSQLAAQAPQLKPALTTICNALGCRIALPMQIKAISIELGELQTLSADTFSYATMLHNNSASGQAWPSIELILTDAADKTVLRRVFAPRDYLVSGSDIDQGFAARSEQAVKLYFELARINASGYHVAVFYP
jgi:predicted Zn finger-like uncharacterized protein